MTSDALNFPTCSSNSSSNAKQHHVGNQGASLLAAHKRFAKLRRQKYSMSSVDHSDLMEVTSNSPPPKPAKKIQLDDIYHTSTGLTDIPGAITYDPCTENYIAGKF